MSKLGPTPIERLAEHLAARPIRPPSEAGDIDRVADWLDYSLNRCGLVVIDEQQLTRVSPNEVTEEMVTVGAAAIVDLWMGGGSDLAREVGR